MAHHYSHIGKDPLSGHSKYEKVKDLSAGAFGFVQLARNKNNGSLVAIKFLERGPDKVSSGAHLLDKCSLKESWPLR